MALPELVPDWLFDMFSIAIHSIVAGKSKSKSYFKIILNFCKLFVCNKNQRVILTITA